MDLQMHGARVGRAGDEVDELRVARIAYVQDREAIAEGLADIRIAPLHDDLDAVAAARLVRMAHERDVAGGDRRHREAPQSLRGWGWRSGGGPRESLDGPEDLLKQIWRQGRRRARGRRGRIGNRAGSR